MNISIALVFFYDTTRKHNYGSKTVTFHIKVVFHIKKTKQNSLMVDNYIKLAKKLKREIQWCRVRYLSLFHPIDNSSVSPGNLKYHSTVVEENKTEI